MRICCLIRRKEKEIEIEKIKKKIKKGDIKKVSEKIKNSSK